MLNCCRLYSRVLELYQAHEFTPIQPSKVFSVSDIEQAFRYFLSSIRIGKVVVLVNNPNSQVKVSNFLSLFHRAHHKIFAHQGTL